MNVGSSQEPIAFLIRYQQLIDQIDLTTNIPIFPGKSITIGRDKSTCDSFIDNSYVSKRHFRIYSVIYEQDKSSNLHPLVYCEDLESTNGTYVNNRCIGMIGNERTGHLLGNGDIIEIRPHWWFKFHQPCCSLANSRGKKTQEDLESFKDEFSVSERILGKGHYGTVFLAEESSTSRQLACKIIDLNEASYEITGSTVKNYDGQKWINNNDRAKEGRKLIMRELMLISSKPHIINLKKAFCSDTTLYMFTELAPAGDLFSYLESNGGYLTDLQGRVISRQVVLAVKYMHSQGIIHRDIKPENVLIMQTDFGSRVVLTDFGFANDIDVKTGRLLSRLGTEGFTAPEVKSKVSTDEEGYTMAADIWSLGVLTACLLTGSIVIPRDEMFQLHQQQGINRFLGIHDSHIRNRWQSMKPSALNYICSLLVSDPAKRISAAEAIHHSWYTKPATEASMIEIGYKRVIKFWKPRYGNGLLEQLPRKKRKFQIEKFSKPDSKFIRLSDTTFSPYFNLDRHLERKWTPTAKNKQKKLGSLILH